MDKLAPFIKFSFNLLKINDLWEAMRFKKGLLS